MILGTEPTQTQVDVQRAANPAPAHSYSPVAWAKTHVSGLLMLGGIAAFALGPRRTGLALLLSGAGIELWRKARS